MRLRREFEVFLEAVCSWQRLGVVAEMVLAELAGGVAEVEQDLGDRRRAGPQIRRDARQLWRAAKKSRMRVNRIAQ